MVNYQVISFYVIYFSICFAYNANSLIERSQFIKRQGSRNYNFNFQNPTQNKLILKVYYETLCPASADFFTRRLQPAVQALGSHLKVIMYPYGNAETKNVRGSYKFTCQHGPAECYGNKLHACAIGVIKNNTKTVLYNTCLMKYSVNRDDYSVDFTAALNWCGYKYKVPIRKVRSCALSKRGANLLRHFGEETNKLGIKYVPYVMLDGTSQVQDKATMYLMATICQILEYPPPFCESYTRTYDYVQKIL